MTATRTARSHRPRTIRGLIAAFTIAILLHAAPAWAITAGEVLDRMSKDERFGYITGAIDIAMYLASVQEKNNPKAECILEWYYGKNAKGPQQVIDFFRLHRERPAVALINVLINRTCSPK